MAQVEFDLKHGLKVGDDVLKHVVMGELTAGDIIDAQADSERVVMTPQGPALVSSPALVGALTLCKQIKRIGNMSGPLELSLLKKLQEDDLFLLQEKSAELSLAAEAAGKELEQRGRADDDGA